MPGQGVLLPYTSRMSLPSVVGRWVKVVRDGGTFLVEFHVDHTVTERDCFDSETWDGSWEPGSTNDEYGKPGLPGVRLNIGGFTTILTQDDDGMSGHEHDGDERRYVRLFRTS